MKTKLSDAHMSSNETVAEALADYVPDAIFEREGTDDDEVWRDDDGGIHFAEFEFSMRLSPAVVAEVERRVLEEDWDECDQLSTRDDGHDHEGHVDGTRWFARCDRLEKWGSDTVAIYGIKEPS